MSYDNPPCHSEWEENKDAFISNTIQDICMNIAKHGDRGFFPEVFNYLYEYIEDNLEKFLP